MPRKEAIDTGEITDVSFYILSSLMEKKHGYLVMKSIEESTDNEVLIGPASLYTTLKKLLKAGLIRLEEVSGDGKKVYQTTEEGIEVLKKEVARKKEMIKYAENFLMRMEGNK